MHVDGEQCIAIAGCTTVKPAFTQNTDTAESKMWGLHQHPFIANQKLYSRQGQQTQVSSRGHRSGWCGRCHPGFLAASRQLPPLRFPPLPKWTLPSLPAAAYPAQRPALTPSGRRVLHFWRSRAAARPLALPLRIGCLFTYLFTYLFIDFFI